MLNLEYHSYSSMRRGIFLFDLYEQIKGDSPEMVEYIGMKNLLNAVKGSVGLKNGKVIFGIEGILVLLPRC